MSHRIDLAQTDWGHAAYDRRSLTGGHGRPGVQVARFWRAFSLVARPGRAANFRTSFPPGWPSGKLPAPCTHRRKLQLEQRPDDGSNGLCSIDVRHCT